MIELSCIFTFEAAHFLPSASDDSHNKRLHGHSFKAEVIVGGEPNPDTGILIHLEDFRDLCNRHVRDELDHRFLNDIKGLEHPTLENICVWIWKKMAPILPNIKEVILYRESCGQKCRLYDYKG